jgi:mono/diheme cytochrome c family protein
MRGVLQDFNRGIPIAVFFTDPAKVPRFRRNLEESMRFMVFGLMVCLGSAAAAAAQDAKVAKGEQLYAEQKCGLCHSVAEKGNKKGPLDGVGSKLSNDDLRQWIVDAKGMTVKTKAPRKPEMKNYALPKDDVDALVAYMASLKKK